MPRRANRVFALLRHAGVVDDPGHDGLLAGHGWRHLLHDGGQHGLVAPRCRAHWVLERLPRRLDAVLVEPGGNGFNGLALAWAATVILQGLLLVPVRTAQGLGASAELEVLDPRAWSSRRCKTAAATKANVPSMILLHGFLRGRGSPPDPIVCLLPTCSHRAATAGKKAKNSHQSTYGPCNRINSLAEVVTVKNTTFRVRIPLALPISCLFSIT